MRKSRKLTLNGTGIFHKMWKGHNNTFILDDSAEKKDYLTQLALARNKNTAEKIEWHSFCLMGNHVHETGSIHMDPDAGNFHDGIKELGAWMRRGHGNFGARYNKRHGRTGKVANDRPQTREIQDDENLLKVMFYGDANPVRAGMVAHPCNYQFSTYQFYAYGKKSAYTESLTPPRAYLSLGKTPAARQKKYRELCDAYLRVVGVISDAVTAELESPFIGSSVWREFRRVQIKTAQTAIREGP